MNGPLATMIRIHLRTARLSFVVWVTGIGATMALVVFSITSLYDTRAKIHSYAIAVHDDALVMLNGKIAGIDSLGGIVANEFGFLASFVIPFMAVSLVARMTRRNEELGRLEAMLAGRIGRSTPLVAAILLATLAEALTAAVLFASLAGAGVPVADGALYALSQGSLGLAFVAVAALAAQVVEHSRGVHAIGLGAIIASYLLRGVGDVRWPLLTWISPLGWQEQTRAFGDQRWWPLLLPLAAFALIATLAVTIAARRDLGSALLRSRSGDTHASAFLRHPVGIALRTHRGSLLGWVAATVVVSATFGSVAQPLIDAVEGNPAIAVAMGGAGMTGLDVVLSMTALILALMGGAYAIQAVGVMRAEETSGRLEARLAGDRSRWAWLSVHLTIVGAGTLLVSATGGAALALASSWSIGDDVAGQVARAIIDFLPAVIVFGALAALAFAVRPRLTPAVRLFYAASALIAYLADPLDLAEPVRALSPFHLIGNPPVEPVATHDVVLLCLLALTCVVIAYGGFRRRAIPEG